ncbi:MAG: class I SAM-dependent methyltransferase [Planctomycetota bacterium]
MPKAASKNRVSKKKSKASRAPKPSMASQADRHDCYQRSVQCVEAEIDFVDETFKDLRGRRAVTIREDFAGTANTSCEWVRRHNKAIALAVDLDPDPIEWGRTNNIAKLTPAQQNRVSQIQGDVRDAHDFLPEVVLAMNFSWMIFKTRDELRTYLKTVHESLAEDGMLIMDSYGGSEAYEETRDKRVINSKLTYIWDQHRFDPVTGDMDCFIHFHFPDGSKMKRAFSYHWRLWTIPELRELLAEAGFSKSTVYWEGTDEDSDEGNGEYEPTDTGDADPSWVSYIVAER